MPKVRPSPPGRPAGDHSWVFTAYKYLRGIRRKDPTAYRQIRRRLFTHWRELDEQLWIPLRYSYTEAWRRGEAQSIKTTNDPGTLCALVLEEVVNWAIEDRTSLEAIGEAEKRLRELQELIAN